METVTDKQVINRLVESEAGKAAAAAILREGQMHRVNLAASIVRLKRERGALARQHADDVEASRRQLEQARKAMTEAEGVHRQACMVQAQHRGHYDTRIRKLESELKATAPAIISDFITWCNDQETVCTDTGIIQNARVTDKINTHTSEAVREYYSNAESLRQRLASIRNARAEAEKLKDKVLDTADIETRLQELRDGLPAVTMQFAYEK